MPPDDSSQDDPMTSAAVAAMFTEAQTGSDLLYPSEGLLHQTHSFENIIS